MSKNKNKTCAVAFCISPDGKAYFSFPRDATRQKTWLDNCFRADFVNVKTARICEIHFPEEYFERDFKHELLGLPLRRKLSVSAIPTLHLHPQNLHLSSDQEKEQEQDELKRKQKLYISSLNLSRDRSDEVLEEMVPETVEKEEVLNKSQGIQCSLEKGIPQVTN